MIKEKIDKIWSDRTLRNVVYLFIIIKISIFILGVLGQTIPVEMTHRQIRSDNILLNPWTQFDAGAYLDIAESGYNPDFDNGTGNYGWYPLYPLLIRIFSFIGYDLAAFLISNIASFFAILMLYLLVKEEMNEKIAYKTIFYILLFPTAYILTAMYTESLFLLFSLLCFWFAKKERYLETAIFGFLASLTRLQGVLLFLPMLYLYLYNKKFDLKKIDLKIIFIFMIPLGTLTLMGYHFILTGDAFIQLHTQEKFTRGFSMPWTTILNTIYLAIRPGSFTGMFYYSFSLMMLTFFITLTILSFKHLRRDYSLYLVLSLILPLMTGMVGGMTRFMLILFPAFMVMAKLDDKNRRVGLFLRFLYIIFIILLILFTIKHVNEDIFIS